MSFVKGFSTSFAGFLKSPGQGLRPRLELDGWGRSSPAAALLLTGGSAPGRSERAGGRTFSAHRDLQARSHRRTGGRRNRGSPQPLSGCPSLPPRQVPLLHRGTPPAPVPAGISRSLARGEPLNEGQSSEGICRRTYCLRRISDRSLRLGSWVHSMVFREAGEALRLGEQRHPL